MTHIVFHSWESGLKNKFKRTFIQDALVISKDVIIDRDSYRDGQVQT